MIASKSLYLIALLPPKEICEEIKAFKEEMKDRFNAKHALKLPAHITLQRPFWVEEHNENTLKENLETFVQTESPFSIDLNDFGCFTPRVIFVKISNHEPLIEMQTRLQKNLSLDIFQNQNNRQTKIHPHITLASRDLQESVFPIAWNVFQNRKYAASFTIDNVVLFKHTGKIWLKEQVFYFNKN